MSEAMTMHPPETLEPAESPLTPDSWGKLGMWVFLAGDAAGFGVLLASYGAIRVSSTDWPVPSQHFGIQLTAFMTFLLICSSVTMVKSLEAIQAEARGRMKLFLFLTVLGGAAFLGLQVHEWTQLIENGLKVYGNPWGSTLFGATFFVITGFHGLHVTGGVIYLTCILVHVSRSQDMARNYKLAEIAGLYWHFVDLVWIMVFTFIYLL